VVKKTISVHKLHDFIFEHLKSHETIVTNNKFSKVHNVQIYTPKSLVLLYTNNEQSQNDIKKTIPLIMVSKRMQSVGINLT
jgi:hypothetical protein